MSKNILQVSSGGETYKITLDHDHIEVDDHPLSLDIERLPDGRYSIIQNNKVYTCELINLDIEAKIITLRINQAIMDFELKNEMDLLLEKMGIDQKAGARTEKISAPMPGLILEVLVGEGDQVKAGTPLIILEAMKMENVIKAQDEGTVQKLLVQKGQSVEKNQVLIQF